MIAYARHCIFLKGMADAGGPGNNRKWHGVALADLVDKEGFDGTRRKIDCMFFSCLRVFIKEKKTTLKVWGELIDIDTSNAVPKRIHMLAYTWSKWVAFADPVQQTRWLYNIKITPLYVVIRNKSGRW